MCIRDRFQQLVAKLPAELQQQLHGLSAQFTPPHSPQLEAQVATPKLITSPAMPPSPLPRAVNLHPAVPNTTICLLYTSDAADDLLCVDLGGRRIIKKKKEYIYNRTCLYK
eukprot:TRINITY_DN11956_c0_g1_i1.p1 TRINITY_DN11956_c0_g1~~TRINITY_DN11956_c0_g1_i1.p1  ORF type:complete len:111 (-),score=47.84 TRINITY_DN11956_c0_g1_i1:57-389(-)